ncbi:hypothetical protein ATANTOWER_007691, partial [Ataeniobius toweri]|nr:hypothetical protein [Ataeniobius toweri]
QTQADSEAPSHLKSDLSAGTVQDPCLSPTWMHQVVWPVSKTLHRATPSQHWRSLIRHNSKYPNTERDNNCPPTALPLLSYISLHLLLSALMD